jgi:hypothetical protein
MMEIEIDGRVWWEVSGISTMEAFTAGTPRFLATDGHR